MAAPRLDVVIVAYRSRDLLGRCLDSLRAHPPEVGPQSGARMENRDCTMRQEHAREYVHTWKCNDPATASSPEVSLFASYGPLSVFEADAVRGRDFEACGSSFARLRST